MSGWPSPATPFLSHHSIPDLLSEVTTDKVTMVEQKALVSTPLRLPMTRLELSLSLCTSRLRYQSTNRPPGVLALAKDETGLTEVTLLPAQGPLLLNPRSLVEEAPSALLTITSFLSEPHAPAKLQVNDLAAAHHRAFHISLLSQGQPALAFKFSRFTEAMQQNGVARSIRQDPGPAPLLQNLLVVLLFSLSRLQL